MAVSSRITGLPSEVLEHIFGYLTAEELSTLSHSCRYLYRSVNELDRLWKWHCKSVWVCYELDSKCTSWRQQWQLMCRDFGRYRRCYAGVKNAWTRIEGYLRDYEDMGTVSLSRALADGVTEEQLLSAETKLGFTLPIEYRCALRLHNGQRLDQPSFLGGLEFYDFSAFILLLPLEVAVKLHVDLREEDGAIWSRNPQYMMIAATTSDAHQGNGLSLEYTYVMALNDCRHMPHGHVVQTMAHNLYSHRKKGIHPAARHCPHGGIIRDHSVGLIGEARSFKDWLASHAESLPFYTVVNKTKLLKFYHDPVWKATTRHWTITVALGLDPTFGLWSAQPDHYRLARLISIPSASYSYRVSIKMHDDAPQSEKCQLVSRCWVIKDSKGHEEVIEGPGIVGETPIFTPGHIHHYASCSGLEDCEYSTMEGHYTMQYLLKDGTFTIRVPQFRMTIPNIVWA